ncbi:hypothetical protein [Sphingopyxis sp.]|uniref:EF-hand domain-containing protein n=1 Tax=Sphingopyxis sp. TaxID=1908224 RepID=UPI001D933FF9|nr:hypothetical protein [Sphingopyxis sp.]
MISVRKKRAVVSFAAVMGFALTAPAWSQGGGRSAPSRPTPPAGQVDRVQDRMQTPDQDRLRDLDNVYLGTQDRVRVFDRDRDGSLSRPEFQQWHDSSFKALDSNGDGEFRLEEFQAVRLGPGPRSSGQSPQRQRAEERAQSRKAERFRLMDGDGNGAVSRTEYMNFGEMNYLDADGNDDGQITVRELQQFHRGW